MFSSDLGSGWGSAASGLLGGHKIPWEMRLYVDEGFVMAQEHQAGESLVSAAEQSTCMVQSVCSGLASALTLVQISLGALEPAGFLCC